MAPIGDKIARKFSHAGIAVKRLHAKMAASGVVHRRRELIEGLMDTKDSKDHSCQDFAYDAGRLSLITHTHRLITPSSLSRFQCK